MSNFNEIFISNQFQRIRIKSRAKTRDWSKDLKKKFIIIFNASRQQQQKKDREMRKSEKIIMIKSSRVVFVLNQKYLVSCTLNHNRHKKILVLLENVESLNLMQTYLNIIRTKMNNFSFFLHSFHILLHFSVRIFSTSGVWLWMMMENSKQKKCVIKMMMMSRMMIMGNVF